MLMGYFSALFFAVTYLIYKISNFLLPRYQRQLGFQHLYNIASFPFLLYLVNFFYLLSTPIFNYVSRYMEREADRFGIEITRNNEVAAQLFADAVGEHLANPRPGIVYKVWRSSHPSLGDRIDFCNNYCPWEIGQPLKYGEYFQE
jgi:Zn-dependent protease with chaperone function